MGTAVILSIIDERNKKGKMTLSKINLLKIYINYSRNTTCLFRKSTNTHKEKRILPAWKVKKHFEAVKKQVKVLPFLNSRLSLQR